MQIYFSYRVYIVSGRKRLWPALAVFGSFGHAAFVVASCVVGARLGFSTKQYNWAAGGVLACLLWTDLINTIALCHYLWKGRDEHGRHVEYSFSDLLSCSPLPSLPSRNTLIDALLTWTLGMRSSLILRNNSELIQGTGLLITWVSCLITRPVL